VRNLIWREGADGDEVSRLRLGKYGGESRSGERDSGGADFFKSTGKIIPVASDLLAGG